MFGAFHYHAKNSSEITKILIDAGADVNYAPENGITGFSKCSYRRRQGKG